MTQTSRNKAGRNRNTKSAKVKAYQKKFQTIRNVVEWKPKTLRKLTPAEKGRITKLYKQYARIIASTEGQANPNRVVRLPRLPRETPRHYKARLREYKKRLNQNHDFAGIVLNAPPDAKVKITKSEIRVSGVNAQGGKVTDVFHAIDAKRLAGKRSAAYIDEVISWEPKARFIYLATGKNRHLTHGATPETFAAVVEQYKAKYLPGAENYSRHHDMRDFVTGVVFRIFPERVRARKTTKKKGANRGKTGKKNRNR